VDQRREKRGAGLAVDQDVRRASGRTHHRRIALEQRDRVGALAGQSRAQPVEKQVFGTADNGFGQLLVTQACQKLSERLSVLTHTAFSTRFESSMRLRSGSNR